MATNIRELRHRILIEQLNLVGDGQGGHTSSWSSFATVWALVTPKNANELFATNQIRSIGTHVITIRWIDGLGPQHRIIFNNRIFHIKGIRRDYEQRFFMFLDVEENVKS